MNALQSFNEVLQSDPEAWALRINARWRQSVENIIEAGQLLIDAKAALVHGQFETMVQNLLDFSPSVAQRLMSVARDNRLTNPAHAQLLPRSWTTLYELTKLSDEEFATGLDKGMIGPDMERADVALLRARPHHESAGAAENPTRDNMVGPAGLLPSGEIPGPGSSFDSGEPPFSGALSSPPAEADPDREAGLRGGSPVSMPGGGLAIAHNRIESADSLDFFPTPPWATRALFEHVFKHIERLGHCKFQTAWEPACGEGHMAEVLKEYFLSVYASDIAQYGYGDSGDIDFIDDETSGNDDWIITNPPFNDSTDFVMKAIKHAGTGVAMFVRMAWLETTGRYEKIFRDHPPTLISFFAERVPLHKGRWEPDGATFTAYIWLVWIKGAEPRAPFWIPPGCRESLSRPEDIKKFGKAIVEGEAA